MHQSFKILPGVDQNKTPALNEAAISESQLVRFIPDRTIGGLVQKLGGWAKFIIAPMGSIVRALVAWEDTNANSYLGVGAEGIANGGGQALQVIFDNNLSDITPKTLTVDAAVDVTTTFDSNAVLIRDTGRRISSNDSVYIQNPISVNGLVLFGQYQCYNPGASENTYTIYAFDIAGNPAYAPMPAVITGASGTGTIATITYEGTYEFVVGESVVIAGLTSGAAPYNGTWVVTGSSPGSVSFASSTTASASGSGTVENVEAVPYFTTAINSNIVTVTLNDHGYSIGDSFAILIETSVGGLTLYGNYIVRTKISNRQFTIQAAKSATSTASIYENGGLARYIYYKGQLPPSSGIGYGIGTYGGSSPVSGYGGTVPNPTTNPYPGNPINAVDWTLDNWGQILIACPLDGPIYQWSPVAGDPIALVIPEAPPVNEGAFIAMPQRQIVAWGTTFNGIKDPLLIRWCDVGDYNSWTATIVNQAGSYRIPKGSRIIQCIQGPQQGLIWTDLGCWAMQYVGPPYVYQFNEVGTGCGLIGRKAAGSVNGVVYWMGPSQFYRLAGSGVEPIRCPVWDVIFQNIDLGNVDAIRIAPNSRFGEISWYYPTIETRNIVSIAHDDTSATVTFSGIGNFVLGSTVTIRNVLPTGYNGPHVVTGSTPTSVSFDIESPADYSSGGTITGSLENSSYVKYNYILDQWDYGTNTEANPYVARSAWINESVLGPPIGAGLNQYLYQHEISSNADGIPMNSYFQTGYFALTEADVLMFIDQVWPDMKWGYYGGSQNANILLTFFVTSYPNEEPIQYGPYEWGALTSATKYITPRFRGRLVSIRIESADIDSWWRLGNIRYRVQQDGRFL